MQFVPRSECWFSKEKQTKLMLCGEITDGSEFHDSVSSKEMSECLALLLEAESTPRP